VTNRSNAYKRRDMGEEQQSIPSLHNSAASVAAKRHNVVANMVQQNADGSAASKVELMMDSDAVMTFVGQIIHVVNEYLEFLLTKPHDFGPFQCRLTRHIVQYIHSLTFNDKRPSSETISFWNICAFKVVFFRSMSAICQDRTHASE
jgi:hypothetical protein